MKNAFYIQLAIIYVCCSITIDSCPYYISVNIVHNVNITVFPFYIQPLPQCSNCSIMSYTQCMLVLQGDSHHHVCMPYKLQKG